MRLAVVGFIKAVEHAVNRVALEAVLFGPFGDSDAALLEALFDLFRVSTFWFAVAVAPLVAE